MDDQLRTHSVRSAPRSLGLLIVLTLATGGCEVKDRSTVARPPKPTAAQTLDSSAEAYVRLALALGEQDPDCVDAYYGPPEVCPLSPLISAAVKLR